MKTRILLAIPVLMSLSACMPSVSMKTSSAAISQAKSDRVIDGKTSKIDIVTMFGSPNGYMLGGMVGTGGVQAGSLGLATSDDRIMHYKDCTLKSQGKLNSIISVGADSREICKVFSALMDENNIVIAHTFLEDNLVTQAEISAIKPNQSTLKDVVRGLGAPASVLPVDGSLVYLYETCVSTQNNSMLGNWVGADEVSIEENCQRANVVINKATSMVTKVNFTPYIDSEGEVWVKTKVHDGSLDRKTR